jgi:hypothetical protein
MEPEGSLPHSQDLATCPSPGPNQHEPLRLPSLPFSPVIIFVKKSVCDCFTFEREVLGPDIKEIHSVDEKEESEENLRFSQ